MEYCITFALVAPVQLRFAVTTLVTLPIPAIDFVDGTVNTKFAGSIWVIHLTGSGNTAPEAFPTITLKLYVVESVRPLNVAGLAVLVGNTIESDIGLIL
jgi:hypothetical protein